MKRKASIFVASALASVAMAATALPAFAAPGGSSPNGAEVSNRECVELSGTRDCRHLVVTPSGHANYSGHARGLDLPPSESGGAQTFQECAPSREPGEEACFHQVTTPSGNDNNYLHFKPAH